MGEAIAKITELEVVGRPTEPVAVQCSLRVHALPAWPMRSVRDESGRGAVEDPVPDARAPGAMLTGLA
jgi:hypothetical protein